MVVNNLKFITDKVESIEKSDIRATWVELHMYDKHGNDWYDYQSKYSPNTLKVMYDDKSRRVFITTKDSSRLVPAEIGNTIIEIEYNDDESKLNYNNLYYVDNKLYNLKNYEVIVDGKVVPNREIIVYEHQKKLQQLKFIYMEQSFEFRPGLYQPNRPLDQNNLGNITAKLLATGRKEFKNWKFKDASDEDTYATVSLNDMMEMSLLMEAQTTASMVVESTILSELEVMPLDELLAFDPNDRFYKLYKPTYNKILVSIKESMK